MSADVNHKFLFIVLISLAGLFSCGEKYAYETTLFSTFKDGGKIYVDVEIMVHQESDIARVKEKEEEIKQGFYIITSEYRSDFVFARGKRALVKIIENVLHDRLKNVKIKFNVTNYKLIFKEE